MWDQIKGSEYRLDWRSWVLVQTLNSYITNPAISLSLGLLSQAIPPPQHPPLLSGPDFVTLHPHHDVCVCAQPLSHVRLFVTPWTVACQALLSMEFSRHEYWSQLPFPSSGDLPDTGIKPVSSTDRWVLYHCAPWEALHYGNWTLLNYTLPRGSMHQVS